MSEIQPQSLTTAAATATPEKKILFGKYEVGRLLGCGGFAKVYHARNIHTGQSVAIKAISKARVEKNNQTAHVTREVTVMRRLRHPHIIRLIEVLASKTKVYFILEFAKCGELFAKVAKGRFSEDLGRRYFQQLISAVGYCHARGVFHRDLKPENLLLDENFKLKVTDFGLSALKEDGNEMLGTLCGTPAYVAPEVLGKKGYFGDKVDIWSCGIILFVLTAGYLPFNDTNLMNLYRKIYKGEFKCPKWMSGELKGLLHRLLDVNPDTRITIDEIINDPWFKKDYTEVNFRFYDDDYVKKEEGEGNLEGGETFLNAFDLISFSPGFNLSGLFMRNKGENNCCETFLSAEAAETVVGRVETAAGEVEGVKVAVERVKGGMGVRLEGQNGDFGLVVEVHRLTEELVVVEVRNRGKEVGPSLLFWKDKLRPKICNLIYQSARTGDGPSNQIDGPSPGASTSDSIPGPSNRV
ncbi:CBL-interacting serine/threonine-protein kinase 14-like [Silene latifolia]|uniref:CBL-interacting serine/threonine-protein kinase 14-like n=1 Tax=Silene latifolia TaxID=37657 RepID=UPI003D77C445